MTPFKDFYEQARAFLRSPKFPNRKRGAHGRLERWYHLVKCLRWVCQEILPGGRVHFELASKFLVALGRT